jgi:hypothetical protein
MELLINLKKKSLINLAPLAFVCLTLELKLSYSVITCPRFANVYFVTYTRYKKGENFGRKQ